jgi:hypothetical protein
MWLQLVHMASAGYLQAFSVAEQQLAPFSMLVQPPSGAPGLAVVGMMVLAAA